MLYDHYNPPIFVNTTDYLYQGYGKWPYDTAHDPKWYEYFYKQVEGYRTRNVLVLWGDDFAHRMGEVTLQNAKDIISNLTCDDSEGKFDIHFSSISKYLDSVYREARDT